MDNDDNRECDIARHRIKSSKGEMKKWTNKGV